jgi:predicted nucleotidyltransferase
MLKLLKKCLDSEKKDKTIFDIVVYGSSVKGKTSARDIDIAVIFLGGTLRERLDKIQDIKAKLKSSLDKEIDIKQILLQDLFSSDFLARTGILLEGESIFRDKKFCETLGFKAFSLFWYDLAGLTHTQKVKFNYILAGRRGLKGIIKELEGERLVNGAVKIPIPHSIEFEEVLKANNIHYKKKDILEAI